MFWIPSSLDSDRGVYPPWARSLGHTFDGASRQEGQMPPSGLAPLVLGVGEVQEHTPWLHNPLPFYTNVWFFVQGPTLTIKEWIVHPEVRPGTKLKANALVDFGKPYMPLPLFKWDIFHKNEKTLKQVFDNTSFFQIR